MGTGGAAPWMRTLTPQEARAAYAKGESAERRVLAALNRADRPWWIGRVRRARAGEDRGGVDVVIDTTDMGRLYLQVKSSRLAAEQWQREHADDDRPIGVVVVGVGAGPAHVYGRVLAALILLREQVERRR